MFAVGWFLPNWKSLKLLRFFLAVAVEWNVDETLDKLIQSAKGSHHQRSLFLVSLHIFRFVCVFVRVHATWNKNQAIEFLSIYRQTNHSSESSLQPIHACLNRMKRVCAAIRCGFSFFFVCMFAQFILFDAFVLPFVFNFNDCGYTTGFGYTLNYKLYIKRSHLKPPIGSAFCPFRHF